MGLPRDCGRVKEAAELGDEGYGEGTGEACVPRGGKASPSSEGGGDWKDVGCWNWCGI